jgi:hypothetical protein
MTLVIPSEGAKRRSRGIVIGPTAGQSRRRLTLSAAALLLAPWLASGETRASAAERSARASAADSAKAAGASAMFVGERLSYDVRFGSLKVGTGAMEVRAVDEVRGRDAWHTVFTIKGGVPLYKVDDRMESWIDTASFTSLRFVSETNEGRRHRTKRIELYPERGVYVEEGATPPDKPTVEQPLDEAAFIYFLRRVPLVVGETYSYDRYFKPDRNPIRLEVLRRERIEVPAGTFETIVVRPIIKAKGIFSENGQAEVWLTDDARHVMVQMKAKVSFGSLNLQLRSLGPAAD